MKRFLLYTLLILCALTSSAQGWRYEDDKAMLLSSPEFLDEDIENPTALMAIVGKKGGKDFVLFMLYGNYDCHDFRKNQQYILARFAFGEKEKRWRIKEVDDHVFSVVDSASFVRLLRKSEIFFVTLPVYEYGKKQFMFFTEGYPLDW